MRVSAERWFLMTQAERAAMRAFAAMHSTGGVFIACEEPDTRDLDKQDEIDAQLDYEITPQQHGG